MSIMSDLKHLTDAKSFAKPTPSKMAVPDSSVPSPQVPYPDYTPAVVGAIAGLGAAGINYAAQIDTNEMSQQQFEAAQKQQQWQFMTSLNTQSAQNAENMQFQQAQVNWNQNFAERQFNEQQQLSRAQFQAGRADVIANRERQDTAYQRTVADAKAAGLSPLAVLGGSTAGSPVSTPSSGMPSVGSLGVASGSSLGSPSAGSSGLSHFTAPRVDAGLGLGQALDTIAVLGQLRQGERRLDIEDQSRLDTKERANLDRAESARQHTEQLDVSRTALQNAMQQHGDKLSQQQSEFAQKMVIENSKLQEAIRHNTVGERQASEKVLRDQLGVQTFQYYKNDADYNIAMASFVQDRIAFEERMLKNGFQSASKSSTGHFSVDASVGVLSGSGGFSQTDATRSNESLTYESENRRFWAAHSYPMRGY